MGHVRDLPERELAVDVENDFRPSYRIFGDRQETISALKKAVKNWNDVILASDPDREGEAIAWHLSEVLHLREPKRIEFHEITSEAVRRALDQPRGIDMRLVNAQQARRVVDRLVGYRLSPFLWSKVQKGIGAGRGHSVALRLVVDREEEIRAFQAVESWTVNALLSRPSDTQRFKARLARRLSDPEAQLELRNQAEAEAAIREWEGASYRVTSIESKQRTKNAPFPYITSTLQQDASSRLRFSPKRTMRLAQDLYEGVELGAEGATGLITYMRTDSIRVSDEADKRARGWIGSSLRDQYLGPRPQGEGGRRPPE